jgi:hypothetical protein
VAPNLLALGLVAAGLSFLGPIYWATQYGYRASLVPDEFQGRVNSVYRITAFSGIPLGTGASGLLLQRFGPRPTVFLLWIGFLLVALATGLNPRIRSANYGR